MSGPARHPALITASATLATLLYSIDWTIASVALPHMQGTFSATPNQISWVITSYIVASAVMIPTTGWLRDRFGCKRVFVCAIAGFVGSSILCGTAESLALEVAARIVQGASGGLLLPLSHSIILDCYPPERQGRAMAVWGGGSVFGSFIGPTIGGYLTDYFSWRAIFYINVPFGMLALVGTLLFVQETARDRQRRLDWYGFLVLALGVGALQMMLDRGGRLDWFESEEIVLEACLAGLGFYLFIAHSLTARAPFLDLRLLTKRTFFVGLAFVFLYGLITLPPLVLMPAFLQDLRGYTIDTIGLLQSPRGAGMLLAMFIGGRITGSVEPRVLIAIGLLCLGASSAEMASWTLEVGVWPIVWTGLLQGVGSGLIMVPIQFIAFPSIAPEQRTEASSVFNLVRSVGSSIGVSVALTFFVHTSTVSHARLTEHVNPYHRPIHALSEQAGWNLASTKGLAKIESEVERQAAMIGYSAIFTVLAAGAIAGLPGLLLLRRRTQSAGEPLGVNASNVLVE